MRLEVPEEIARYTWNHHLRAGGIDLRYAPELEKSARDQGADPHDWRLTYRPVPLRSVLVVEASDDGERWEWLAEPEGDRMAVDSTLMARIEKAGGCFDLNK